MKLFAKLFGRSPSKRKRSAVSAAANTNLTAGFSRQTGSADRDIYGSLKTVRDRARWLSYNNDYVRRWLSMVQTHVVGPSGFGLQVRALYPDGTLDEVGNTAVENAFWRWASRGSCDVTGRMSLRDVCRTAMRAVARDGECIIRKVYGASAGNRENFALQVIDIDRLDHEKNMRMGAGNVIKMGVEMNELGRPVACWLRARHPGDDGHMLQTERAEERVPASDLYFLGIIERPEQTRCLPWVVSSILRLKHLGSYEEAAVVAANVGAAKMGFFTNDNGDGQSMADDMDATGEYVQEATPGHFSVLPDGTKFEAFDPNYPHEQFGTFVKASLRGIASGLDVSYNSLANDLEGVNYSSLRAGVLEERDAWMAVQSWFIEHFLEPMFSDWLRMALLTQSVTTERGAVIGADKFAKFNIPKWQGRRWQWVDPLKDVQAAIEAINAGLTSRREVIAGQGRDINEVWADLAAEQKEAERLGLVLTTQKPAQAMNEVPADERA